MDLELNLNFTLSKILEKGKELTPIFGKGYTGMENLGKMFPDCFLADLLVLGSFFLTGLTKVILT